MKQNSETNRRPIKWLWIIIAILVVLFFFWFISCRNPSGKDGQQTNTNPEDSTNRGDNLNRPLQDVSFIGFENNSNLQSVLRGGLKNFQNQFGTDIVVESIQNKGPIGDISAVGEEMLKNIAVINKEGDHYDVVDYEALHKEFENGIFKSYNNITEAEISHLLSGVIKKEDYKIIVKLKNKAGREFTTTNSISSDGKRNSGGLFHTTFAPMDPGKDTISDGYDCGEKIILKYTWTNIPKVKIKVCLSTKCKSGKMRSCMITSVTPEPDLFSSCAVLPIKDKSHILENECITRIDYKCATGFKKVDVDLKEGGFKVEGVIGLEFSGAFFTVRKNCGGKMLIQ